MVPTGMLGRRLYVPLFLLSFLFCSSFVLAKERKEAESVLWGSFPSSGEERKLEEGLNQEKEEGDGTTTRQTTQTLYPYVLQNECTVNIQHNITQAPEEQTVFFDALSLLVSDLRMILPETCRRSSLWILCNLAFPCQSQVCSVTREDCEFAFKDCPPSDLTLNCSSFPTESEALEMEEEKKRWWGGEERGWIDGIGNNVLEEEYFVTVQESAETPNPVTTCLADRGEEIQCCLDPFTKKSDTDECVLACPSYPFGETRYKALTYTHFALLWITTVLVIAALVPLLFLKQTLTFPKYAMPAAMVATLFWLHNEMWSIYVGFDEYLCGDEEDLVVAYAEFLSSPTCFAQFYVFHFFGILAVSLVFGVSVVFLYIFTNGDRDLLILEKPFVIFNTCSAFIFLFVLIPLMETEDYSNLTFGFAFSCVVPREGRGIFVFTYFTVLVALNLLGWIFSVVMLTRRSHYLFFLHWRMFFFMACQMVVQALFLGYVNGIAPSDGVAFVAESENYATCVALNPRSEDNGCEYDTSVGSYGYWCVYFFTLDFALGAIALVVYVIQPANRQWWTRLFVDRKAVATLSQTNLRATASVDRSQSLAEL